LEVDSVVRKGKNADARDTFVIQAGVDRTQTLSTGFPQRREDLYAYDALVIANVEGDFFTRAQLAMMADFVGDRGGGLLVAGSRSGRRARAHPCSPWCRLQTAARFRSSPSSATVGDAR